MKSSWNPARSNLSPLKWHFIILPYVLPVLSIPKVNSLTQSHIHWLPEGGIRNCPCYLRLGWFSICYDRMTIYDLDSNSLPSNKYHWGHIMGQALLGSYQTADQHQGHSLKVTWPCTDTNLWPESQNWMCACISTGIVLSELKQTSLRSDTVSHLRRLYDKSCPLRRELEPFPPEAKLENHPSVPQHGCPFSDNHRSLAILSGRAQTVAADT